MPKIKRKKHKRQPPKDEDIVLKTGRFRIYFQNYYTIISLINDILIGGLYLIGSIAVFLDGAKWISQWSYLAGAFFMLMRPTIKIIRNIFIYDKEEFKEKIKDPKLVED